MEQQELVTSKRKSRPHQQTSVMSSQLIDRIAKLAPVRNTHSASKPPKPRNPNLVENKAYPSPSPQGKKRRNMKVEKVEIMKQGKQRREKS